MSDLLMNPEITQEFIKIHQEFYKIHEKNDKFHEYLDKLTFHFLDFSSELRKINTMMNSIERQCNQNNQNL